MPATSWRTLSDKPHRYGQRRLNALLPLNFTGHQTHDLQGQRDLTYLEITAILGGAIGKPDLQYQLISSVQFAGFIEQMGWAKNVAVSVAEMVNAQNVGHVCSQEMRSKRNTTPTRFEQFVAETFVPAYEAAFAYKAASKDA